MLASDFVVDDSKAFPYPSHMQLCALVPALPTWRFNVNTKMVVGWADVLGLLSLTGNTCTIEESA